MKKLKGILVLILLLALLASPISVLASNVSGAKYYGLIQVTNNGTAVVSVATTCNISTENLVSGGYLNSSANNCAIQSSAGADLPFQPSVNSTLYPWGLWVPSMGANSIKTDILYTANATGGKIRYFPSATGMTTTDSASLELGDNFTITQSGWINTDNGTDKNAVFKSHSFRTFVSPTVSENITSELGVEGLDFIPNDWASIPDHVDFSFTDGNDLPFSIVVWFNPDDLNVVGNIVSKVDLAPAAQYEWRLWNATDWIQFNTYHLDGTKSVGRKTGDASGYEDSWTHLVATYDGSEASAGFNIYLNGVDSDTTDVEALAYTGMGDGTSKVLLGSRDDGGSEFFDGQIAEIKIYSVELSPAEVLADMGGEHKSTDLVAWYELEDKAGNPTDSSANGHNADSNIAVWFDNIVSVTATGVESGEHAVKTTREPEGALDFVKANTDEVKIPDHDDFSFHNGNDLPFSIVVRINFDDATVARLVSKYTTAGTYEWSLRTLGADEVSLYLGNNDLTKIIGRKTDAITAYEGEWIHIVATYDGTEAVGGINIYINAVDADTGNIIAGVYDGMVASNSVVELGSRLNGASEHLDGLMSEVKIYNVELIPAEVLADYRGTHKSSDLVAWYELDEGVGLPQDSSGNAHHATHNEADWTTTPVLYLYVDDVIRDRENSATGVPNSGIDWAYYQNLDDYWHYTKIWIDGVLQQHIEWEYDTTFTDLSGNNHDATPSFRTASSDEDVSAELVSFLPISEAKAPAYVLEEAVPFIEEVPVIVSDFDVSPDPAAGEFPLAGVIAVVAAASTRPTPAQLPLVLIAGFVIISISLAVSGMMRKYGSGSIFVKIIVIAGVMGVFVAIGNFGIDFWMIFIFLIIGVALSMASRHVSWQ